MPGRPPETRRCRIAVYVLVYGFTALWVALLIRSIAMDLYSQAPASGLRSQTPGAADCASELEALFRRLNVRSGLSLSPTAPPRADWDRFAREFEDRLGQLQERCLRAGAPHEQDARDAIRDAADKLENLRAHLSRCGQEGEDGRRAVAESIARLKRAASPPAN